MRKVPESLRNRVKNTGTTSREEKIEIANALPGKLEGYDCPKCKNKGCIYALKDGYEVCYPCDCMKIRESLRRIEESGLKNLLSVYTFNSFSALEPWQKAFKSSAQRFVQDHNRKWFFAGGQVGAGKTHICTAIVGQLLKQSLSCRYMLWRDESVKIKALVNDDAEYYRLVNPLKTVDVLYIDDLFKTQGDDRGGKKPPTQGDVNLAFEIINYRYAKNLITILSSERTIDELLACDEAVGSRIYQRTKDYCWCFAPDTGKNYRLKG